MEVSCWYRKIEAEGRLVGKQLLSRWVKQQQASRVMGEGTWLLREDSNTGAGGRGLEGLPAEGPMTGGPTSRREAESRVDAGL